MLKVSRVVSMVGDCGITGRLCIGTVDGCSECRITKERQAKIDFIRNYEHQPRQALPGSGG